MTSNQATNQGEEYTQATKKVITADVVRSALQERIDMMKDEGMAGAAQYEEAYGGQGKIRGAGHAIMNNSGGAGNSAVPRKMNYAGAPPGYYQDGEAAENEQDLKG